MLIFSYGTLTLPLIRDRVLGHPVETREAVLRGYSKVCGWDYLTLVPSEGCVKGVVFEADKDDVGRMDVWEDVPIYRLERVAVECDGDSLDAYSYIMPEPPAFYETVEDSCIAAIPLEEMIADLEAALGLRSDIGMRRPRRPIYSLMSRNYVAITLQLSISEAGT